MPPAAAPKTALAIIDLQNDFCPPHGSLAVPGGRDLAPIVNKLFSQPFALKVATRDFHPADHISFAAQHAGKEALKDSHTIANPNNSQETQTTLLWPAHCVQDTPGCELISGLETARLDLIVDKGTDKRVESYSAFGPPFRSPPVAMTGLKDRLQSAGITRVFVVGLAFDFCVKHTAIDAAEEGFETIVIEEACKAINVSDEGLAATRNELQDAGVKIVDLSAALELMGAG